MKEADQLSAETGDSDMATATKAEQRIKVLRDLSIYRLSNEAGCAGPDSVEPMSAGARFLDSIRNDVIDRIESEPELLREEFDELDDDGMIHEIADAAPDVYTSTLWEEFVDLAAYTEDPTDLGFEGSDMEQGARICLFIIAERLAFALFAIAQSDDDA